MPRLLLGSDEIDISPDLKAFRIQEHVDFLIVHRNI